ncbi:MAG: ATP-binding protein [Haloarculaceae archaeon]
MSDSASLVAAGVDALTTEFGVVDDEGELVYTNEAWKTFTGANTPGGGEEIDPTGSNYLTVTDSADDEDAQAAAAGLREVLGGEREEFTLEYPCHEPDERRWFLLHVSGFEYADERYASITHEDITDRKLAEMAAERRTERLESVAGVLAHDIRNPLAVALGYVQMTNEDDDDDTLQQALSALERMEDIVENALALARYDDVEETHVVDLETVAERAWTNVQTKGATLEVAATAMFEADPDLLDHVFENLFRNAVEHAGQAVTVTVGTHETGFYVEDDGAGVPEGERETVFERGATGGEGTGLGLDIVAQIAEAHGWRVDLAESEAGGARFEFAGVAFVE